MIPPDVIVILNQNLGILSLVFSGVVATSTIIYALLTWKLVNETSKFREFQTEPRISLSVELDQNTVTLMDLIIENIGLGPAFTITFEIFPDFNYFKDELLSQTCLFKNGISYLAPKQKIRIILTDMADNYEEKIKQSFKIRVTYFDVLGKRMQASYPIEFHQYRNILYTETNPLAKIANNVEKIHNDIHHLTEGFKKLQVICYIRKDEEEGIKKIMENINEEKETM
jgi:hypothetical protein